MADPLPLTDHPIEGSARDLLGRARFAMLLAGEIRSLDARHGAVVGLLAPWGHGKTSLLNMLRERLAEDPSLQVIDFNPWLFSGTDQLVATFFEEVAAQLRMSKGRLAGIADELEEYGEALSPLRFLPVVGPWLDRLGTGGAALGRLVGKRSRTRSSVTALRTEIENHLSTLERPVVVFVDDLDRLGTHEIRDIFGLVRLTASFPSVIYVLAFDRNRVEAALDEEGIPGRAYLERILQVAYEVPAIPDEALRRVFLDSLQQTLEGLPSGPFDEALWPDVFIECIRPLIKNLRDVKRYLAALPLTLRQMESYVALVDVLAAEALRMFLPETHGLLASAAVALTSTREVGHREQHDDINRRLVLALVESGGAQSEVVRSFCLRLFPASGQYLGEPSYGSDSLGRWGRERRLAHPDVLRFYLERVVSSSLLAKHRADTASALLGDEQALRAFLNALDPDDAESVIADLEAYEDTFAPEVAIPACRALLDQLPRLRSESRGMFDFGADLVVRRVVLRLLRHVAEPDRLAAIVDEIYEGVSTLHSKFILLTIVGHRKDAGHKLVSEEDATRLEQRLRSEIASADPESLALERDLLRLLWWYCHPAEGEVGPIAGLDDPRVQAAVLRASLTEVQSQAMGSRAVRREQRLGWEALTEVLGGEERVREAVAAVGMVSGDERLATARDLAQKYLGGWRPKDWSD